MNTQSHNDQFKLEPLEARVLLSGGAAPADVAPGAASPAEPASQEVWFDAPVSDLENDGGTAMNSVAEGLAGLAAAATPLVEANPAATDLSCAADQSSPEHIGTGQNAETHPLLSPASANPDSAVSPVASPAAGNPWPEVLVTTLKAANAPPASPEAGSISAAEATGSRVYATVMLNNYDANLLIRQITPLMPAQGGDIWVELLGGPAGGAMTPVVDAAFGLTKFNLSDPGFFDGGCGLVQGVQANEQAQFQLRAWRGAASFEAATERGVSEVWSQVTGRWNADALPPFPPQGPALKLPGPVFIGQLSNSVALVALNNQEANQPIYYLTSPDLASGQEVWVELLAGPKGGAKAPVYKLENGGARFSLAQPGYFDAGLGFIPNATGGAEVEFQLRVWMNAATYEDATEKGQSAAWTQSAGSWDWLHDPAPASAPALELPAPVVISRPPDVVATVALNNFDASQLVYYQNSSTQASGTSFWIELLAGPVGGKLNPVFSTSSHTGRFRLSDPGHFEAGIGTVAGVEPNGVAEFQLRAWKDAGTYAQAAERAETVKWTQAVGSWDRNAIPPAPATGPALRIPGPLVVAVPPVYSATIDLGLPDTNALIFYQVAEARASGSRFSVELLGGPVGGTLKPVAVANGAQAQFPLAGPGYFNAGVGVLPGVAAGQEAQFQLRVWKNAPVYAVAEERGQTPAWTQATGIWQTNAVPAAAPVGVALRLPGAVIVKALDQVATVDLTNLGTGMAILMGSAGQMASGSTVQVELLGGDPGVLDQTVSVSTTATSASLVGVYPIHIAPVVDDNYAVTVVDTTLRVKLPLQVQVSADEGGRQLTRAARLKLAFSESVGNSLGLEDLALVGQASGAAIGAAQMNLECQPASRIALLTFPGLADGQLPDGRWVLTVKAAGIQDPDGFPLNTDYRFRFGVLSGDANRDGVVNDLDLYRVWQNWIKPFGAQDLAADLNGDQKVDQKDLDLVIANYLATVTQSARGIGETSLEAAGGIDALVSQAPPLGIAAGYLPKPGATAFAGGASLAISPAGSAPDPGAAIPRITSLWPPCREFSTIEVWQGKPSWDRLPYENPVY